MRPVVRLVVLLAPLALESLAAGQQAWSVFDASTVVIDKNRPPIRRLADFDLDGDVDAVGVQVKSSGGEYRFAYYQNQAGGFSGGVQDTSDAAAGTLLIEVGHLNGDAWPDVCILKGIQRHDWLRNETGPFVRQPTVTLPASAMAMALADLDHDGIDDVAWMDSSHLHVSLSGGGSGSLPVSNVKHSLRLLPGGGPAGSDLYVSHVNQGVRLFHGTGTTLVAAGTFPTGITPAMMDTGDVDADGDVDAVVFGMTSYRVLRRLSPADWVLEAEVAGGPAEFLRDVDGDGDPDGVCCGGGGGGTGTYEDNVTPSSFQIALNEGGVFAPAFAIPGVGSPQMAGVADVDLDGDRDLVAGRCVYYADGPVRPLHASSVIPPTRGPRSLWDHDSDGDVDAGFSVDSVYANDGTGRFTLEPSSANAPAGTAFRGPGYPGDFDGDGDVDLLAEVCREGRTAPAGTPPGHDSVRAMALLCNDGAGGLLDPVPAGPLGVTFLLDAAGDPERSLLADADGDGDLDLLTRTEAFALGQAETRLWANDGTGSFRAGGRLDYRAVWAGDIDADGDMDLIACGSGYEGTSTYLLRASNPRPGRLPTLAWNGTRWSQHIESGLPASDFDQNGYPDFAAVLAPGQFYIPQETFLLDNRFQVGGSLSFHSGLERTAELAAAARIALGDVQGNATIDALVGPLDEELLDICEVHLDRVSGPPLNFDSVQQIVSPGELVDLDGDGDRDVLGASITLNRAP